jgi:hypothetical protein
MSNAMAIASVTAVLKSLLHNGVAGRNAIDLVGEDVRITSQPPDRIVLGAEETPRINLFLWQVTPNTGLRRLGRELRGETGRRGAPFAYDLHYMVAAYGAKDLHAELLLGYALQVFSERPRLDREQLQAILSRLVQEGGAAPDPALGLVAASDIAERISELAVEPSALGAEELTKLWSALQAHFRPSALYRVSLVLEDA